MEMKTSALTGACLGWAVSLITNPDWTDKDRLSRVTCYDDFYDIEQYEPHCNWEQGGPLIVQENVDLISYMARADLSMMWRSCMKGVKAFYGPTPLIAAMRCIVASKFGDDVELPMELS